MTTIEAEKQRIQNVSSLLYTASQSIRILTHVEWQRDVKRQFFADKCAALPKVTYPEFDPASTLSAVRDARALIKNSDVDKWLESIAVKLEYSALMMASTGSKKFYEFSEKLYGKPTNPFVDGKSTPLDLANTFDKQKI